jgi:hypothetical protein
LEVRFFFEGKEVNIKKLDERRAWINWIATMQGI